jgi:hypothetical protein
MYGVVGLAGLGGISALTADQDEDAVVVATATTTGPESTPASTDAAVGTAPPLPAPSSDSVAEATPTTATAVPASEAPAAPVVPVVPIEPATSPPSSPPSSPPTTVPGSMLALDVLATIPVEREHPDGYDRDRFRYGDTVDPLGCRTRALVLKRDSLTPAQVDAGACTVVAGDWYSRYDGLAWSDPAELEIDHVVALKEAWDSGAWAWDDARLTAFGNDVDDARSLVAVTGAENTAKSDKDPSNWIPPNADAVCAYVADWTAIKARWGLSMDESEFGRIRNLLIDRCPGQTIAPWLPAQAAIAPPAPVVIFPAPTPIVPAAGTPIGECDPSYPTLCIPPGISDLDCGDITDRRFQVLPPDPHGFDGNHDGVGCEG